MTDSEDTKLSIIVPVLNESRHCVALLKQLQTVRKMGSEVIVVDGGSEDDTLSLAQPYADCLLSEKTGRARQMNTGANAAKGQWLWFLHADTFLPDQIENWLATLPDQKSEWGFFPIRLSGNAWLFRVIERCINWRSRFTRVATGDQGMFIARSRFQALGGFDEQPLMEDVAFSKQLRKHSKPSIPSYVLQTSSRRWQKNGIIKTVLLMWSLRLAYFLGVSPQTLVKVYYRA